MSTPDPGENLHLAQLDYFFTISELAASGGHVLFSAPDPVRFSFPFETGSTTNPDGSTTVTWDTSQFDQAAVEAGLTSTVTAIITPVATLLGLDAAAVTAAVTIRRVWTYAPNVQGTGVGTGRIVNQDVMPFGLA